MSNIFYDYHQKDESSIQKEREYQPNYDSCCNQRAFPQITIVKPRFGDQEWF